MRRLPAPLRGLVLDHLRFPDVLSATTTDRTGRALLGSVRRLSGVNDRVMSSPHLLNKVPLCEVIHIESRNALVFERLAWALQTLRHLRGVAVRFAKDTDETAWRQSCTTLSKSPELGRLRMFRPDGTLTNGSTGCDEFKSLLLGLDPDCALVAALAWRCPAAWISELIRRGANPNGEYQSFRGRRTDPERILEFACSHGQVEVIRVLLEAGAIPPDREGSRMTDAFVNAMMGESLDILRLLFDSGHRSSFRSIPHGWNLLHCFALSFETNDAATSLSMVELICERQPSLLTQVSDSGCTPLMHLTQQHCYDLFRPNDPQPDRDASFKSLAKCMVSHEARRYASLSE